MGMGFMLAGFAVSQVFEGAGGAAVAALKAAFDDPGSRLPRALDQANERAWQVLELALQDRSGLLTRLNHLPARLTSKEKRALADALSAFLAGRPLTLPDRAAAGRALKQLRQARERGLLELDLDRDRDRDRQGDGDQALLDQVAGLQRYSDPFGLLAGAHQTIDALAGELERAGFPELAGVLAAQPPHSPPLLVTAFAWFFQRQVESDPDLARGLQLQQLQQLSAAQAAGFAGLEQAMSAFGGDLRDIVDGIAGVREGLAEVHALVLDIHREQRQAGDAPRDLYQRLDQWLQRADAQQALVSPRLSYSLHGEQERRLVKQLIDDYRGLPEAQRRRLPALLDGIGKLQMGLGDPESLQAAERSFDSLAHGASDPRARAQGAYNAYRAALERRDWPAAQAHLDRAMALDPGVAPFPVEKYELQAILGAGGFGVALLCRDRFTGGRRVIKALHPDDLDRPLSEVFAEVAALGELRDPALIRIHGAHYVDWSSKARPYIEMEWFDAPSLEAWLREHGTMSLEQVVALLPPLVAAMRRVHAAGLLHRDLSPDNLLLRPNEQPGQSAWDLRIIDFGLAYRLDAAGLGMGSGKSMLQQSLTGKWDYAPPEQRMGGRLGAYSDVYSFGRTVCKALFGTPNPVGRRVWDGVPDGLADLLEACVQERIADRPAGFDEVAERLAAWRQADGPKPGATGLESWAAASGRDDIGRWADIVVDGPAGPVTQRLRWVPPGEFMMGSPESESGRFDDEGPRHRVTLGQGFWLFDTPCTQALWEAVMGDNPSRFNSPDRPVERVSWDDAQRFIAAINADIPGLGLSLPSEAQWEYACRAGTKTAIYTGDLEIVGERNAPALDPIAWYGGNSGKGFELDNGYDSSDWKERQYPQYDRAGTHPVARKQANPWGLHDMLGNVLEWVEDPWHGDYKGAPGDGRVWPTGDPGEHGAERVVRFGSWLSYARSVRAAYRNRRPPGGRDDYLGFRCARSGT